MSVVLKKYSTNAWSEQTELVETSDIANVNKEAYLTWGGKNLYESYSPVDAGIVEELGANRLAFTPADSIIIEYSRDAGNTWIEYGIGDSDKINFFNGVGSSILIGKNETTQTDTTNYRVRVTINTGTAHVYTQLNKFVILCSTNGSDNCYCTIQARKQANFQNNVESWDTFSNEASIDGWSGYNVINTSKIITYGNDQTTQYGQVRFTFGCKSHSNLSYSGLRINKIFGFGGMGWFTPSTMAKNGHLYSYDANQNAIFPSAVKGVTFYEDGTSLVDKYVSKNQGASNVGKMLVVGTDGNLVLADIPESGDVTGTLDDSNNIILTGNLTDGTYTLKYENSDGTFTTIGDLIVGAVTKPYTNLAEPNSTNTTDYTIWINNARIGSDGAYRSASDDANGHPVATNYIPVQNGDVIRWQGLYCSGKAQMVTDNDKSPISVGTLDVLQTNNYISNLSYSGLTGSFTIANSTISYFRFGPYVDGSSYMTDVIITKNEEITN